MAYSIPLFSPGGFKAENDLSAKQYHLVEIGTAADEVDVCDGAGDIAVGILQNKPEAGEAAEVMVMGVSKLVADGTVTRGDRVGTSADGQGITKTADADWWNAIALESAVVGDIFTVLLLGPRQRAS